MESGLKWMEDTEREMERIMHDMIVRRYLQELAAINRLEEIVDASIEDAQPIPALWLVSPDALPVDPQEVWAHCKSYLPSELRPASPEDSEDAAAAAAGRGGSAGVGGFGKRGGGVAGMFKAKMRGNSEAGAGGAGGLGRGGRRLPGQRMLAKSRPGSSSSAAAAGGGGDGGALEGDSAAASSSMGAEGGEACEGLEGGGSAAAGENDPNERGEVLGSDSGDGVAGERPGSSNSKAIKPSTGTSKRLRGSRKAALPIDKSTRHLQRGAVNIPVVESASDVQFHRELAIFHAKRLQFEEKLMKKRAERERDFRALGMSAATAKLAAYNELLLDEQHDITDFDNKYKPRKRPNSHHQRASRGNARRAPRSNSAKASTGSR
jgi:hypothetical protein